MSMNSAIVRIVDFCARYRWTLIIAGTLLMIGAAAFDAARFSVNTDIEGLISEDLPWHQRQLALSKAFPQKGIIAVVKAPTAENAEQATNTLAQNLSKHSDLFPVVEQPDSGEFFERNGLLFAPPTDVKKSAEGLTGAQPFMAALAGDPSLRGVMTALSFAAEGAQAGQIRLEQLAWPLSLADQTLRVRPETSGWIAEFSEHEAD
jgi:hypothetical protein